MWGISSRKYPRDTSTLNSKQVLVDFMGCRANCHSVALKYLSVKSALKPHILL